MIFVNVGTPFDEKGSITVSPTVFPDGTSQVWKLPGEFLSRVEKDTVVSIRWDFVKEAEFIHLAQLVDLLRTYGVSLHLEIPYLPYARQDKRISNESTFALQTFAKLLNSLDFAEVRVLDAHSNRAGMLIRNLEALPIGPAIQDAYSASKSNMVLFPDAGAEKRYWNFNIGPSAHAEKDRDPLTGHINSIRIVGSVRGKKVLIVDDICDGGATFIFLADAALSAGAKEIHLFVTHGIFSKGLNTLRESGIRRIFTHKGEVDKYVQEKQ